MSLLDEVHPLFYSMHFEIILFKSFLLFLCHFYPCENSIIGGSFIIAGLYTVTWGSYRERHATVGVIPHGWEAEPLIHDKIGQIFSGSSSLSASPKSAAD